MILLIKLRQTREEEVYVCVREGEREILFSKKRKDIIIIFFLEKKNFIYEYPKYMKDITCIYLILYIKLVSVACLLLFPFPFNIMYHII